MFYLTTHSIHFIYGYMESDIWLRTILIVRKETRCRHIGYSLRLTARVLLYAPSHRQDSTYHSLCYTSRGALAGTRNSSMGSPHEGSIQRPIAPWANALTTELGIKIVNKKRIICRHEISFSFPTASFSDVWCSSVVRAFARGAMGRPIDPSWWTHWAISRSSQCSTTGVPNAVVCVILSVGWSILNNPCC